MVAVDMTRTEGDTLPPVVAVLTDANGPVDLSAATSVRVLTVAYGREGYEAEDVDEAVDVTDAVGGEVSWTPDNGFAAGLWSLKFRVDWGGEPESYPEDFLVLLVHPNIDVTP